MARLTLNLTELYEQMADEYDRTAGDLGISFREFVEAFRSGRIGVITDPLGSYLYVDVE